MEKEIHAFLLRTDGNILGRGTGLCGKCVETLAAAVNQPPAAEQFHVVPRRVVIAEVPNNDLTARLGEAQQTPSGATA